MNNRITIVAMFATLCIILSTNITFSQSTIAQSDIPRTITYQGLLSNSDGSGVPDGTYPITVSLYADPTGTLKVWHDSYSASVVGGVFSLHLGSGNHPLPDAAAMNRSLWIGTQIGDGPEMYPLTPLAASPYALNVSDKAITTDKLADGAVTADKVNMPYISALEINGEPVAGVGTVLKLKSGDDIRLDYDEVTNSVTIASNNDAQTGSDLEKGGAVQDGFFGTGNWIGRDVGLSLPAFGTTLGTFNTIAGGAQTWIGAGANFNFIGGGETNRINSSTEASTDYSTIGGGDSNIIDTDCDGCVIAGGGLNAIQSSGLFGTISGGLENTIEDLTEYSVIAGGHANNILTSTGYAAIGGGELNRIETDADYSTVGGGEDNVVATESPYGTIGGGLANVIGEEMHAAFIGGGQGNLISSYLIPYSGFSWPTIAGGHNNSVHAAHTFIGGGHENAVHAESGTLVGGWENRVYGQFGFVGGGKSNICSTDYAVVGGGLSNLTSGEYSFIGGGNDNTISGAYSTIVGGNANSIPSNGTHNFIGGGSNNVVFSFNELITDYSGIASGADNVIGEGSDHSAIGGGYTNTISLRNVSSFIGGGSFNQIMSTVVDGTIGGGDQNIITAESDYGTIGGGQFNEIGTIETSSAEYATVGGGKANRARAHFSTIPGGDNLRTTSYAQTAVGFYNAPRGNMTSRPSLLTMPNDPLFMVGNGNAGLPPIIPGTNSNAFEVSYNGHSIVYGEGGVVAIPYRGATYTDNVIYAWGDFASNGAPNSRFGVKSYSHPAVGKYVIELDFLDPVTNASLNFAHASITATAVHDDATPEAPCPIITTSRIGKPGANKFEIWIRDTDCHFIDAPFMFKVTGRQAMSFIIF